MDSVTRAAELLLQARRDRRPIAALPADCRPAGSTEAYQIQDKVSAALGPIGAWKVGARDPHAEPNCAPIAASLVHASPRELSLASFNIVGIEAELAFTLVRDLPPRERHYDEEEVAAAVSSVHAAIEIVDSRFVDPRAVDAYSALADFQNNGALIVGRASEAAVRVDQRTQAARLFLNSEKVVDVVGGNTAGNVFRLLAWLANHAAARCGGLRRDDIVTTGSCTGLRFLSEPRLVRAEFPGVGDAAVQLVR
jgi:2-keto-4-pentenoate hydratase